MKVGNLKINVFSQIPRTIKIVGLVSLLINTSTLMIFSLFGMYLHDQLHIDFSKIGFLDGAVECFSFIMKIFSGVMSDFLMNRKLIFLIGSIFLFIAKPMEAIATSYWPLFQAKILERIGNGLQSTPRDAIVGDWAPKDHKATCFGMRQSLAALGSVIGSILATILFWKSNGNYQFVFWMASIPSFISVCLIITLVKDKGHTTKKKEGPKKLQYRKLSLNDIKNLGGEYWVLIGVACTYMVSKVTESIVIIYAITTLGLPKYVAPFCMILYQLGNSFIALPAGIVSDKLKTRENIFIAGIVIFLISDLLFIFSKDAITIGIALLCLGMYIGITQSIFPAKIIDLVPTDLKGTGIGIFNLVCALSFLAGGGMTGYIAEHFSLRHSFVVSSGLATISLVALFISKAVNKRIRERQRGI